METVRAPPSGSFGCSQGRTLPELAIMRVFGDFERLVTIVRSCGSRLDAVPPAAPKARRLWHSVWHLAAASRLSTLPG